MDLDQPQPPPEKKRKVDEQALPTDFALLWRNKDGEIVESYVNRQQIMESSVVLKAAIKADPDAKELEMKFDVDEQILKFMILIMRGILVGSNKLDVPEWKELLKFAISLDVNERIRKEIDRAVSQRVNDLPELLYFEEDVIHICELAEKAEFKEISQSCYKCFIRFRRALFGDDCAYKLQGISKDGLLKILQCIAHRESELDSIHDAHHEECSACTLSTCRCAVCKALWPE